MATRGSVNRVVRVVLALLVLAVMSVIAYAAIGFFTVASGQRGWLWGAIVWFLLLVMPLLVLRPRRLRWWVVGLTVCALLAGAVTWYRVPPTRDRLVAAYEREVHPPRGFLEAARDVDGNTWCFKGCPVLEVEYESGPGSSERQLRRRLDAALVDDGWTAHADDRGGYWTKWRWELRPAEAERGELAVVLTG